MLRDEAVWLAFAGAEDGGGADMCLVPGAELVVCAISVRPQETHKAMQTKTIASFMASSKRINA
ncbi:MAG: hypothetical protein DMG72_25275 [Acidobacteria bacterium]|nr:MAG: hypothetical protein DMG72_25275 [Acidobacteriota bacterium]